MSRTPLVPMLKLYGLVWLALFLFAMTAMLVSNGVFGVAWFAVADVALSFSIFVAAAVIAGALIMVVLAAAFGRLGRAIVILLAGSIYALLPFAAIIAFAIYAYVSPASLAGVSFVLDEFTTAVHMVVDAIGHVLANANWHMPDKAVIDDAFFGLSAGVAVLAVIANWIDVRKQS